LFVLYAFSSTINRTVEKKITAPPLAWHRGLITNRHSNDTATFILLNDCFSAAAIVLVEGRLLASGVTMMNETELSASLADMPIKIRK
jgi:hypothetical protein